MKISEMITDRYKLRIPPTVYYELLADVREVEEEQEPNYSEIPICADCNYKMDEIRRAYDTVVTEGHVLDELRAEITTLQNRCYALTKGTMCAFCKYECEYKAETEAE